LVAEARSLIEDQSVTASADTLMDLVETILVYKFPRLSRLEIQTMLHLPVTDLKQTRFYQEVFREGEESGEKKAELALVLRLLKRRLGTLTAAQQGQVERLSVADLGALGEDLLDFTRAADLDQWLQAARGG
jgi:predicted transposase YdaD